MKQITRYLATRLWRIASPSTVSASHLHGVTARNAWERLDAFVTSADAPPHVVRERELVQENARLTIALVGRDPARVVGRVAELHEAGVVRTSAPAVLVLALVGANSDTATRSSASHVLARLGHGNRDATFSID